MPHDPLPSLSDSPSAVRVSGRPGRIRVAADRMFEPSAAASLRALVERALGVEFVRSIRVDRRRRRIDIAYAPARASVAAALRVLADALRSETPPAGYRATVRGEGAAALFVPLRGRSGRADPARERAKAIVWDRMRVPLAGEEGLARGVKRLGYFALALGSFAMSIVAFVLPILPTPPFVVATIYFASRSSPTFARWVMRTPVFGQMTRDLETYGAIRPITKLESIGLTLLLLALFVPLFGLAGIALAAAVLIAIVQITTILLLPTLHAGPPAATVAQPAA